MLNYIKMKIEGTRLGVGTVWFGAVLSETKTKTEIFCGSVRCGFEAKPK